MRPATRILIPLALLMLMASCGGKDRRKFEAQAELRAQIDELCRMALDKIERDRMPMQRVLHPITQGIGFILTRKADLDLEADQVEDLLDLRVAVEKDVNRIEARIKTAAAEIKNEIEMDGVEGADIEDFVEKIGELQAEIENRKFEGLVQSIKILSDGQEEHLSRLLAEELE